VLGTHTLLECARASKKVKLFIHVSTDEVYGDVFGEGAVENAILEPTNPYSCSKAAAEFICKVPCHARISSGAARVSDTRAARCKSVASV
jgi:dTDP-D-glucose 4,6-dehydratase